MTERGQISVAACGLLLALALAGVLVVTLGDIDRVGAAGQRAADQAALAATRSLAADPSASAQELTAVARGSARANGAGLRSLRLIEAGGLPSAVQVTVAVDGAEGRAVLATAAAEVLFSAELPAGSFRPVDLSGLDGRGAVVAAAAAQVGWPYVWGGESRAEGGFDCSGLVDFAYSAAGRAASRAADGGRPLAARPAHRRLRPVAR